MAILYTNHIELQWKHFSGLPTPNLSTGNLPGFIEVPIYVKQENSKTELNKKLNQRIWSMDLWFSCAPLVQYYGHWALQHLFYGGEFDNTIWLNTGQTAPQINTGEFQGGYQMGGLFRATYNPNMAGGSSGWGWVRLEAQKLPSNGNWADFNNWTVPCDGLLASVRINTSYLLPGVYMFNTNAARNLVDKTYLRTMDRSGTSEIPIIHQPGFLVIHPPKEWEWKLPLGELRHIDPNNPFDAVPITSNLLLQKEAPLPV